MAPPRKPTSRWVECSILLGVALLHQLVKIQRFLLSVTYALLAYLHYLIASVI